MSYSNYLKYRCVRIAVAALIIGLFSTVSFAQGLARVGPTDKSHGFPQWYQDKQGLALDLCLPVDTTELASGACVIGPIDLPNADAPIAFPANFPEEAFWFLGDSVMTVPGGRARVVLALEAAFNAGVVPGSQITFARLRILFDAAEAGHYIVTTPYGVREFDVTEPGSRAIFSTEDIGIGAVGDFSGALDGSIGPFLKASDTAGGLAKAPFVLNGRQYLSDPSTTTAVTGSPLGVAFNVFKIEGPVSNDPNVPTPVFQTDQFSLFGRVHTASIPSPMHVERATYGRDENGVGHVDAFADAVAGIGNQPPALKMSGPGLTTTAMSKSESKFYGQAIFDASRPNIVTVTNTADNPPTTINFPIVDEIKITEASYDPKSGGGTLKISATTSDRKAPPKLVYNGQQLTAGADAWTGSITITGVATAPPTVTVSSTYGGRTTVPPVMAKGDGLPPAHEDVPVANGDHADALGATPVSIRILENDEPNSGVTVRLLSQPNHGTAELLSDDTVRYTANVGFAGDDDFQYVITRNGVDSNAASVTITVTAANNPPIARNDTATAVAGSTAIRIGVLGNDQDLDSGDSLDASSLRITQGASAGSVQADPGSGTVLYTPPISGPATATFQYTIADNHGNVSAPATVTVNVTAGEDIRVTKADFRAGKNEWDLVGTSSIPGPGNRLTIDLMRGGVTVANIGVADVDNLGAWRIRPRSTVAAIPGDTLRITSSQNTVLNNVVIRIN
jgi:Bacterial Ig domain